MLIYIYNLKVKDKKTLNTVKRRFYYHLMKRFTGKFKRYAKNAILVDEENKTDIETFFLSFQSFLDVYKIKTQTIEKLLEANPISH